MTKISEVKFNIFFLILALGLVFVASFLGTSLIKAQGQIKIIPTSFSGDWQNPEAVFIQNLGDLATFEKFNIENSAYPLITSQIQKTPTTKTTSISEEIVPEATTTEGISTEEMATTTKTFTSVFILSGFYVAEEFKQNKSAVLLGTNSFWEGIDVPGESLSLLILYKLPFLVPSEPITEAYLEKLRSEGKDSFMHYMLPNALLKYRQGFGRLIRNKTDKGLVLVLDNRILTKYYGKYFKETVPAKTIIPVTTIEIYDHIGKWFKEI